MMDSGQICDIVNQALQEFRWSDSRITNVTYENDGSTGEVIIDVKVAGKEQSFVISSAAIKEIETDEKPFRES